MTPADVQKARACLRKGIRSFFDTAGYLEVDTPALVSCPGTETFLRFFSSVWVDQSDRSHTVWLRTSPELHMKQLLASGMDRIFQIGSCFRNGGELADWHQPEFTMLEWYRTNVSVDEYVDETLALLSFTKDAMREGGYAVSRDLDGTCRQWTIAEIVAEVAGLELLDQDRDLARKAVDQGVASVELDDDFETAFYKIMLERVEPFLAQFPIALLKDYPPSQAALAKVEGGVAKRFEIYVKGVELSNGFYELTDPEENQNRVTESFARRRGLGFEVPEQDDFFYQALEEGIPDSCGNALGFDRWLACLLGHKDLAIVPFRHQTFQNRP